MNCDFDLLSLYLDGALTLPQRVRLEQHLRVCESCSRELDEMYRVDCVLSSWGDVRAPLPASVEARVARSIQRRRQLAPLLALSRVMPAAVGTVAAALLVLVSVNLGMYTSPSPITNATNTPPVSQTLVRQSAQLIRERRSSALFGGDLKPAPVGSGRHNIFPAVD